jgi:hypothetical protein
MTSTTTPPATTMRLAAALADFGAFLARHPDLPTPTNLTTTVVGTTVTINPTYNPNAREDGTDAEVRDLVAAWATALGTTPDTPFPYTNRSGLMLHTTEAHLTADLAVHVYLAAPAAPTPATLALV